MSFEGQKSTILIVDDAPDILSMLKDAVTFEGMLPICARSGREAINLADKTRPDMVLMDAQMPSLNGFETCRILKSEKNCEDVPVIFMTGFDDSEHVVEAFASGGVDFIAKPIMLDQLFARLKVHLTNARRAQSARRALDATGRKIISCDSSGRLLWCTPQAAELLGKAGLRSEDGAQLPWEFLDAIAQKYDVDRTRPNEQHAHTSKNGTSIEFSLLAGSSETEVLIRLFDSSNGTDEEKLAAAFDLTLREGEVLLWLTHGKSNKEIAEILKMSPRTVNKHLEQIFSKIGVENRTAAATLSVRIIWGDL